ncbi:MAG: hypothetical protein KKB20_08175, partial [Proteobacteria bacterium]|nr:hypothetical protein [Pseudomonadota bacterium]
MQLKYFVYYVYSESTGKHYFIDLRKFIKAFCKYDNPSFKAKFIYSNEENMYLFPVQSNLYIFVMTRDNDIIKTIDKGKANYNEIYDKLQQNESLGFASYLLFTDQLYAFASTTMGPKNNSFVSMVNDIFKSIGLDNYEFMSELLRQKTTKAEILKLPVIGRTVIEVSRNHKMFDKLSGMFGKDHEIKSFEVIIKPLIKGEITKAVKHYVRNEFDEQETKFRVKAKADIDDAFSDY